MKDLLLNAVVWKFSEICFFCKVNVDSKNRVSVSYKGWLCRFSNHPNFYSGVLASYDIYVSYME